MEPLIPSDRFPVVMKRRGKKKGFTSRSKLETLIKLDSKYSMGEVEGDGAEITDIEFMTIGNRCSFGEVLEKIEKVNAEPASVTQFMGSHLMCDAEDERLQVAFLRHSILFEGEECFFYFDPELRFALNKLDEAMEFRAGCIFAIVRRRPLGITAAA